MKEKNKLSILVVEDNFVNLELMSEVLESLDCLVDTAENGRLALEKVEVNNYDVIFMDLQMPEMDGFDATRAIRKLLDGKIAPPIIALTANAMQGDRQRCLKAGMDDYLSKPIEFDDIDKILKKHIQN